MTPREKLSSDGRASSVPGLLELPDHSQPPTTWGLSDRALSGLYEGFKPPEIYKKEQFLAFEVLETQELS